MRVSTWIAQMIRRGARHRDFESWHKQALYIETTIDNLVKDLERIRDKARMQIDKEKGYKA